MNRYDFWAWSLSLHPPTQYETVVFRSAKGRRSFFPLLARSRFACVLARAQAVSLCEPPPVTALGITEGAGCSIDTGATGSNTGSNTSSNAGGVEEHTRRGEEQLAAGSGLEALEGSFDREFVDALCRQVSKGFFFYGTNLKQGNE